MAKKQASNLEVSLPKDFDGEVNVLGIHVGPTVDPIVEDFGGNMNILRDKINEIIAKG